MGIGMLKSLCLHRCDTCALSKSVKYDKVDQSNRNRNTFTNTNRNTFTNTYRNTFTNTYRNTFTNTNTNQIEREILLQIQIQIE